MTWPMTWNVSQYERFQRQRQRPAEDLLAALLGLYAGPEPRTVVDLGCGGGFLATSLATRWPGAQVFGIDSSAEMLARAQTTPSRVHWEQADIAEWRLELAGATGLDVIISNAALQWVGDHRRLFPRLLSLLAPGGVLAVQMPRNFAAPSHTLLAETILDRPWATALADRLGPPPVHPPECYVDWLAPGADGLELWETEYWHRLNGDDPVLEWVKGTTLVPVLERLGDDERAAFLAAYGARLRAAYPQRADGTTLFPFRRLFLLARV